MPETEKPCLPSFPRHIGLAGHRLEDVAEDLCRSCPANAGTARWFSFRRIERTEPRRPPLAPFTGHAAERRGVWLTERQFRHRHRGLDERDTIAHMRSVCVFCGSSSGSHPDYQSLAQGFGKLLVTRGLRLVYGGGRVGLMGTLADAVLAGGGEAIGVIPQLLLDREVGHAGLTQLHVVSSMSERKQLMGELADAFVTLPGGTGTMDELFEAWTWTMLGLQHKHSGLLNFKGYYDPLIAFLDRAVQEGFLRPRHRETLVVDTAMDRLLDRLMTGMNLPDRSLSA
jgi:uncharacterized protein (TIGR00730 family)